jgi:hypothetical protein
MERSSTALGADAARHEVGSDAERGPQRGGAVELYPRAWVWWLRVGALLYWALLTVTGVRRAVEEPSDWGSWLGAFACVFPRGDEQGVWILRAEPSPRPLLAADHIDRTLWGGPKMAVQRLDGTTLHLGMGRFSKPDQEDLEARIRAFAVSGASSPQGA